MIGIEFPRVEIHDGGMFLLVQRRYSKPGYAIGKYPEIASAGDGQVEPGKAEGRKGKLKQRIVAAIMALGRAMLRASPALRPPWKDPRTPHERLRVEQRVESI